MTAELQQFASDNYAGICPEAWAAMANANRGHVPAYGEDQLQALRDRGWRFYTFIGGGARFMFAWDADPARVDALARDVRAISATS